MDSRRCLTIRRKVMQIHRSDGYRDHYALMVVVYMTFTLFSIRDIVLSNLPDAVVPF